MTEGARVHGDAGQGRGAGTPPRDSSGQPPVGSLADEAAKLAEVAQGWLRARAVAAAAAAAASQRAGRAGDPWAAATDPVHTAPECRTCPICRARRFARSLDPQVLGHLSDAVGSLGAAAAAMSRTRNRTRKSGAS